MRSLAWFLLTCVFLASAQAQAQKPLKVPIGQPVLVDGTLGDGEWSDAARTDLAGKARLYAKQSDGYVWLAIEFTDAPDGALDLYLAPNDGNLYDLHASAKLGERRLANATWPDWKWWNNAGWVANVSRVDSFEQRTFLPTRVREFQIRRARFPGAEWKIMIELLTPATPDWKVTKYPGGALNTSSKGWLVLDLGR